MEWIPLLVTVVGLSLFEIINSVDNAIINAEVLGTVGPKARKWFLTWGILFAVFIVRGFLPLLIVFFAIPGLGLGGAWSATFSSDPAVISAIEHATPLLLMGAGTFLLLLFLHWLFIEEKHYGLFHEPFIHKNGIWFYAVVSIILCLLVWFGLRIDPYFAFSIVVGSSAFFITQGFKENAAQMERQLISSNMSDWSKVIYLEVLDLTFSIDGVLGAFAFTFAIPLILIGNGIGAIVLRQLTVMNIDRIKQYIYIKNGAMYSILCLGLIMLGEGFGMHIPFWLSPSVTLFFIGLFFWKSHVHIKNTNLNT